jgi:hypothetical protein
MGQMKRRLPTERSFGVSLGLMFAALSVLSWSSGHNVLGPALALVGLFLLLSGLLAPALLGGPNRVWWHVAQVVASVNAAVVLTAFFAVVIVPVGLVMRLFGRNPLRAPDDTSWMRYPARRKDPKHYEHMF